MVRTWIACCGIINSLKMRKKEHVEMDVTRRGFMGTAVMAAGALVLGCATARGIPGKDDMLWTGLFHIGINMVVFDHGAAMGA